jgi:hypothetical protein
MGTHYRLATFFHINTLTLNINIIPMKNYLLLLFFLCLSALPSIAQIEDGSPWITKTLRFTDSSYYNYYRPDTAAVPLWQIGHTDKAFFATDTNGVTAIMTDTLSVYPVNCNNSFTLKIPLYHNVIVGFWHRYQTDSGHDGGAVEFSQDGGVTWGNMKGGCLGASDGTEVLYTENFYEITDTLLQGTPAFSGIQSTTRFSRFQFYMRPPVKSTGSPPCNFSGDTILVRFRFISDTVADTLDGWIIDSIRIEDDNYTKSVSDVGGSGSLSPYPNPAYNGHFLFPALRNEQQYTIDVYNTIGQRILSKPYTQHLQLNNLPPGLYHYRVSNGTELYTGKLLYGD